MRSPSLRNVRIQQGPAKTFQRPGRIHYGAMRIPGDFKGPAGKNRRKAQLAAKISCAVLGIGWICLVRCLFLLSASGNILQAYVNQIHIFLQLTSLRSILVPKFHLSFCILLAKLHRCYQ